MPCFCFNKTSNLLSSKHIKNSGTESFEISNSKGIPLQDFDFIVSTLCKTISKGRQERV